MGFTFVFWDGDDAPGPGQTFRASADQTLGLGHGRSWSRLCPDSPCFPEQLQQARKGVCPLTPLLIHPLNVSYLSLVFGWQETLPAGPKREQIPCPAWMPSFGPPLGCIHQGSRYSPLHLADKPRPAGSHSQYCSSGAGLAGRGKQLAVLVPEPGSQQQQQLGGGEKLIRPYPSLSAHQGGVGETSEFHLSPAPHCSSPQHLCHEGEGDGADQTAYNPLGQPLLTDTQLGCLSKVGKEEAQKPGRG